MKEFAKELKKFALIASVFMTLVSTCWSFFTTTEFWNLITCIMIAMGIYYLPKFFKSKISTLSLAVLFINAVLIGLQPRTSVDFDGGKSIVALTWTILLVLSIITIFSLRTPLKGLSFKARLPYEVIFLFVIGCTVYGMFCMVNCNFTQSISPSYLLLANVLPTLYCQNIGWEDSITKEKE